MNFDRLNPLSRYLTFSGAPPPPKSDQGTVISGEHPRHSSITSSNIGYINPIEVSDWGIEGSISSPTLSHQNLFTTHLHPVHSTVSSQNYYYEKPITTVPIPSIPQIPSISTTENFTKFIEKYLGMNNIYHKFWEQFKYTLVVSNLLDHTMILSKNEQSLTNLEHDISALHQTRPITKFTTIDNDGYELILSNKSYSVSQYTTINYTHTDNSILLIINLIIRLIRHLTTNHPTQITIKLFKILLISSTKLLKIKRLKWLIISHRIKALLTDFLLHNYRVNKFLIQKLIAYKEIELFKYLSSDNPYKQQLESHIMNSLHLLNLNFQTSIKHLLPYMNGDLLESYYQINHIDISTTTTTKEDTNSVNIIVTQLNRFNQLRRLFICQLLSLNEPTIKQTFFIYKLYDMICYTEPQPSVNYISQTVKLKLLSSIFQDLNGCLGSIINSFINFDEIYNTIKNQPAQEDQNILAISTSVISNNSTELDNDTPLDQLINKISNLCTNLQYFQKYNQSTQQIDNIDELTEKVMIFNQFSEDIVKLKQLYQASVEGFQEELRNSEIQINSDISNYTSPRSSVNGEFNLKTFHTKTQSQTQSQLQSQLQSLTQSPVQSMAQPMTRTNSLRSPGTSPRDSYVSAGKKHKRGSGGLQLGLLTVVEENNSVKQQYQQRQHQRQSSAFEAYNQDTLNKLSSNSNPHYSLNSVTSNVSSISDLISSSHITSDDLTDDTATTKYSKSELKLKLEESFNRIYSLDTV
ncbi:Mysoin-binding motif of peroxisomes-domain-containing protein [Scheffersomyces amazonensis]|uniref:Mysoin-binding motif of peroxisomes-domain-containing protein n=1 Tax=Scheffersomyces amazonensis TaxID=1078765 RepID=UPI00315D517A